MVQKTVKIKALWLCSWYPSRKIPYLATFIQRQAAATARLADVAILYVIGDTVSDYQVEFEEGEFLTTRVYYPETTNVFIKFFRQFRAQMAGYKAIVRRFGQPDIAHVQSAYPAAIFSLYLDIAKKIPFVVTEHYSGYMEADKFHKEHLRKLFTKLVFRRASAVLALSNFFIETLKNLGLHTRVFRVVFNVVDTSLFSPNSSPKKEPHIFTFSNFSLFDDGKKNITGVIKSAAKLAEKRQDFVVNLVGHGYHEDRIVDCARSLGVLNRLVFLKGKMEQVEVAQQMQASDCVIMFSNIESQSVVTLEAAACGVPLIATETGGIGERVTPETGILLTIGDEMGLVEAMDYMIDNHHKYDPSVIRSRIVEKCGIDAVGHAILNAYKEVLKL